MMQLFSIENLANRGDLIFLQAVPGFDNPLHSSTETKRVSEQHQAAVQRWEILIALALKVILLFVMIKRLEHLTEPFFHLEFSGLIEVSFDFTAVVFMIGCAFVMYTAMKEISHMLPVEELSRDPIRGAKETVRRVIALIVFINLVFDFDSILCALAITDVFAIPAVAIVCSAMAMSVLLVVADVIPSGVQSKLDRARRRSTA